MHNYQTIIWDWNGTLLNDAAACRMIINQVLRRRGRSELSRQRYQDVFGFPVRQYYERLGFDFSRESFETVGSEFITLYENQRARLRLQPGARSLIGSLHASGIQQVVLSAYRHDTLLSLLREKELLRYFTHITGADDHYARGKQEQGVQLVRALNVNPRRTLLVGDTIHDHEVAMAMNVDCVLLNAGHQSKTRLRECRVPVLENLAGLAEWLKGKIHVR